MARKKKHDEDHVDESWLIPYADILTLLLALFIVLFASSQVDQEKLIAMSQSFQSVFSGNPALLEAPSNMPLDEFVPLPQEMEKSDGQEETTDKEMAKEMQELAEVKRELDHYIEENDLSLSLQTRLTQHGLMITILDKALYDSGSAEIKEDSLKLAREISELLVMKPARAITISGHTDNVPINNYYFRDNWDLSSMRALNFMKIILENPKHDPQNFSASGYGEYRPVDNNKTDEGRQNNRRVEVLILPNYEVNESVNK